MQREDVRRLRLALRRLASIDEEDAARFLLFVPPLPTGGTPALASLAAASVIAVIEKATSEPFETSFWRHHSEPGLLSRDVQYRLALVFSQDQFERATSLASVLADLKLEADPDEIGGLMLASAEVLHRYRKFFRDLSLRIDDSTPEIPAEKNQPLIVARPPKVSAGPAPPSSLPSPRAKPFDLSRLRTAVEAVVVARGPRGTATFNWRINKAGQILTWAAATAFGHLTRDQVKAHLTPEDRGPIRRP